MALTVVQLVGVLRSPIKVQCEFIEVIQKLNMIHLVSYSICKATQVRQGPTQYRKFKPTASEKGKEREDEGRKQEEGMPKKKGSKK